MTRPCKNCNHPMGYHCYSYNKKVKSHKDFPCRIQGCKCNKYEEHKIMDKQTPTQIASELNNNPAKKSALETSGARVLTTLSTHNYELKKAREQGFNLAIKRVQEILNVKIGQVRQRDDQTDYARVQRGIIYCLENLKEKLNKLQQEK